LWNQEEVWIYTQDEPFDKWASRAEAGIVAAKIYAPTRNPHYNESNYRVSVSWPGWTEIKSAAAVSE
jgi:hypothetical protein